MRPRLTLRTSLAAAFGLLALICAGQGGLSLSKLANIRHSATGVSIKWIPSVVAVTNIRAAASEVRVNQLRSLSVAGSAEQRARNATDLTEALAALNSAREVYEPLISSAEERGSYDAFVAAWDRYEAVGREAMRLAEDGRPADGLALMGRPENIGLYDDVRRLLTRDVTMDERGARSDADAVLTAADDAATAVYEVIALALAAAGVAATFSLLRVSRPIQSKTGTMVRLADGDAGIEVPYRSRADEVGAMAAAVQVFEDNPIRTRVLEDETSQARPAAEEQRKAGMRQMAEGFESAVGGIIGIVSSSATELQATAQSMTATATETVNQSTTVAAVAEQPGSSVQEIGRQVSGSAELARLAMGEADQTGMLVRELSAAVSRIGDVVGLVSNIAGQTNLLALNATIEAARAGVAGMGFAVEASEVKVLAGQTAKATGEISGQIAQVRSSTGQAVTSIAGITARIREISGVATSIAAAVEQQGAATQEIVRNVSQTAMGTVEVTSNIAGVAGAAVETGAAASGALGAASELSRRSEHLTAEVGRFLAAVHAS